LRAAFTGNDVANIDKICLSIWSDLSAINIADFYLNRIVLGN